MLGVILYLWAMPDCIIQHPKINNYQRYQNNYSITDMFPAVSGKCGYCEAELTGRKRRWCSEECNSTALNLWWVVKGNTQIVRFLLYDENDKIYCRGCGLDLYLETWHADHIIPVHKGGGGCTIDNFQPLYVHCHKEKTKLDLKK